MLYSELKQKEVFRLDGVALGKVTGAFFSRDTAECVAIAAERGIFSAADMYAMKDVATLKPDSNLLPLPQSETHMFLTADMRVFDVKGEFLGTVSDFYVEPHNKKEEIFFTENEQYSLRKLLFSVGDAVIINRGDQLPRRRRATASTPSEQKNIVTLPRGEQAEQTAVATQTIDFKNYGEYRFLIGRTLTKPISDLNHNVILPSGTAITAGVVELAKSKGKLSELTKYSK